MTSLKPPAATGRITGRITGLVGPGRECYLDRLVAVETGRALAAIDVERDAATTTG